MYKEPSVTLLSWTQLPLETIYSVWMASKNEEKLITPQEVATSVPKSEVEDLFKAVIAQKIPVGEHIDFVFMLENVSVSWREQGVRHRIGTKISPERLGVDFIPDLASSSFWSQSMRLQSMGKFAHNRAYRMPQTVKDAGTKAMGIFDRAMGAAEYAYNTLVEMGVPMEDARDTIPLGAQHRISWKLNINSLQHIIGKRGCFILQLGIWGPIIMGMIEELANKVHPIFRDLVSPPCMDGDNFIGCVYREECRRRLDGSDELPPCPLHLYNEHGGNQYGTLEEMEYDRGDIPMKKQMVKRAEEYRIFWKRDPYTGAAGGIDIDPEYYAGETVKCACECESAKETGPKRRAQ